MKLEPRMSESGKTKYFGVTLDNGVWVHCGSKKAAILLLQQLENNENITTTNQRPISENSLRENQVDYDRSSAENIRNRDDSNSGRLSEPVKSGVLNAIQVVETSRTEASANRNGSTSERMEHGGSRATTKSVDSSITTREQGTGGREEGSSFLDSLVSDTIEHCNGERQLARDSRQLARTAIGIATEAVVGLASSTTGCVNGGAETRNQKEIDPQTVEVGFVVDLTNE